MIALTPSRMRMQGNELLVSSGELRHGTCHFYTRYTGIHKKVFIKINSMYGNLKDQTKLDSCIYEGISYNTKLAMQIQLKVVYMEVSGRTSSLLQYSCMMPKMESGKTLCMLHKQHHNLLPESFGIL